MSRRETHWVVDRIEGDLAVVVQDGTRTTREVPTSDFAVRPTEGAVLRVPLAGGRYDWGAAVVDEDERRRRLEGAGEVLDELRRRDPGGDVAL